jgi:hypothetical protein
MVCVYWDGRAFASAGIYQYHAYEKAPSSELFEAFEILVAKGGIEPPTRGFSSKAGRMADQWVSFDLGFVQPSNRSAFHGRFASNRHNCRTWCTA